MSTGEGPWDQFGLTPAELEILRLLADYLTDAEIADRRVVSVHTVKAQVRSVLKKLKVRSRRKAAAVYRGIAPDD